MLLDKYIKLVEVFGKDKAAEMGAADKVAIEKLSKHIFAIQDEVKAMVDDRKQANHIDDERERAIAYHDNVLPHMEIIRRHVDKLELIVDDEMWPLPKYRELLFIR